MISTERRSLPDSRRIVITGIGLTAPNGACWSDFRTSLLNGQSGVSDYEIRYVGKTLAGVCEFDVLRYQTRKDARRGTRAGSVGIYSANEAVSHAGLDWENVDKSRVGIYLGVTEHGNVETEHEIYELKGFDYDTRYWSHHHNPRTVANNPAGEVALNMGITGPHYTIGAACAAGNAGLIQGAQMLLLDDCDMALAGGVSESIHTFGIFASFRSQGALAEHRIRRGRHAPSTSAATASSWPREGAFLYWSGWKTHAGAGPRFTANWWGTRSIRTRPTSYCPIPTDKHNACNWPCGAPV